MDLGVSCGVSQWGAGSGYFESRGVDTDWLLWSSFLLSSLKAH